MKLTEAMMLYDYNCWANRRILVTAARASVAQFIVVPSAYGGSLRSTLVHILSAERLWRTRWSTGVSSSTLRPEEFPTLETLREYWQLEEQEMRKYLATLDDAAIERSVRFQRLSGETSAPFTFWHLLLQLVNHGTDHRSAAAALLTSFGQSPGDLDVLVFTLERRPTAAAT